MRTSKELREATDPTAIKAIGALRRMAITFTAKALWQLAGFKTPDGKIETATSEPFTGIGFSSRPSSSGSPEALVLMIGDAGTPVIAAVRDEKTRAAIAGALQADETATWNSKSIMVHKADGTIEARSAAGAALSLATKADVKALADFVQGLFVGGSGSAVVPAGAVPQPAGTTVLKGE